MSLTRSSFAGYGLVVLGVVLGAVGLVREGLISIALGTAGVSLSSKAVGRVEKYLPLALSLGLFALALALPNTR